MNNLGNSYQSILEPCDVQACYEVSNGETKGKFVLEQCVANLSPDVFQIATDLQRRLLDPLMQTQTGEPTAPCNDYHMIATNEEETISFWRPQAPSGYASLGDVAVVGNLPLTQQAKNDTFGCSNSVLGFMHFVEQRICLVLFWI